MHWYPLHRSQHHEELQRTESQIQNDGRVNISFTHGARELFRRRDQQTTTDPDDEDDFLDLRKLGRKHIRPRKKDFKPTTDDEGLIPRMNVAILITGSRGDVQPFIALGQTLQRPPYCHRVRICTHPVFRDFVVENGLEFFSIGGDPSKLMAFMVKNPGIIPGIDSIMAGDIGNRKAELAEMLEGAWRACTQAGDGMSRTKDEACLYDEEDILLSHPPPFVADAIIANPPTYAHIHIAEKLSIPCHIMFTMPWSPTRAFPHPLTNVDVSKVDNPGLANFLSYKRMELLTWEGLSDIINHFREKTLGLDAVSPLWGHRLFPRLRMPFTYCWSEALIPKPEDWGSHITIAGFFFLSLASSYKPDKDLQDFLDAGPPPVYIGFGSIVVDDPDALTQMIFDAVEKAGVRALVSKGWGNVGGSTPPKNVFLLGNVPHDWLFPRVSAVVHHGGAGTTAIGIALGKPTVIVPFFGDQPFWASMVYKAGAGPEPVPYKKLTADKLAENIKLALEPAVQTKAHELAEKIKGEKGPENAAKAFHSMPQMKHVGCFLLRDHVAVWKLRRTNVQMSGLATAILITHNKLKPQNLKLVKQKRWYVEEGSQDPVLGVIGAFTSAATGLYSDIGDFKKDLSRKGSDKRHNKRNTPKSSAQSQNKSIPSDSSSSTKEHEDSHESRTSTQSQSTLSVEKPPVVEQPTSAEVAKAQDQNDESFCGDSQRSKPGFLPAAGAFLESSASHVLLKLPIALLYNMANGFHNVPSRLGDTTVRIRDPITGFGSGLKVGAKEFGFGLYDAFSGIVMQPYIGYHEGKGHTGGPVAGVAKGVALGLFGLVSKSSSAILGPFGYSTKGIERELQRRHAGTDALLGNEIAMILRAKEEIRNAGLGLGDGQRANAETLIWQDAKGAGVGKRVVERRVWQGYRELRELRRDPEEAAKIEALVLERWERLAIDENFLAIETE